MCLHEDINPQVKYTKFTTMREEGDISWNDLLTRLYQMELHDKLMEIIEAQIEHMKVNGKYSLSLRSQLDQNRLRIKQMLIFYPVKNLKITAEDHKNAIQNMYENTVAPTIEALLNLSLEAYLNKFEENNPRFFKVLQIDDLGSSESVFQLVGHYQDMFLCSPSIKNKTKSDYDVKIKEKALQVFKKQFLEDQRYEISLNNHGYNITIPKYHSFLKDLHKEVINDDKFYQKLMMIHNGIETLLDGLELKIYQEEYREEKTQVNLNFVWLISIFQMFGDPLHINHLTLDPSTHETDSYKYKQARFLQQIFSTILLYVTHFFELLNLGAKNETNFKGNFLNIVNQFKSIESIGLLQILKHDRHRQLLETIILVLRRRIFSNNRKFTNENTCLFYLGEIIDNLRSLEEGAGQKKFLKNEFHMNITLPGLENMDVINERFLTENVSHSQRMLFKFIEFSDEQNIELIIEHAPNFMIKQPAFFLKKLTVQKYFSYLKQVKDKNPLIELELGFQQTIDSSKIKILKKLPDDQEFEYETATTKFIPGAQIQKLKSRIGLQNKSLNINVKHEIINIPNCITIGPVAINVESTGDCAPGYKILYFAKNNFKTIQPFSDKRLNKYLSRNQIDFKQIRQSSSRADQIRSTPEYLLPIWTMDRIHRALFGCITAIKDGNGILTPQKLKIINFKTFKVVRSIDLSQFDWNSEKNRFALSVDKKGHLIFERWNHMNMVQILNVSKGSITNQSPDYNPLKMPFDAQGLSLNEENFSNPKMSCFARWGNWMAISYNQIATEDIPFDSGLPIQLGIGVYRYNSYADPVEYQPELITDIRQNQYFFGGKVVSIHFLSSKFLLVVSKGKNLVLLNLEILNKGLDTEGKYEFEGFNQTLFQCEALYECLNEGEMDDDSDLVKYKFESEYKFRLDRKTKTLHAYLGKKLREGQEDEELIISTLEVDLTQVYEVVEAAHPLWHLESEIFTKMNPAVVKSTRVQGRGRDINTGLDLDGVKTDCDLTKHCICCISDDEDEGFVDSYEEFLGWNDVV